MREFTPGFIARSAEKPICKFSAVMFAGCWGAGYFVVVHLLMLSFRFKPVLMSCGIRRGLWVDVWPPPCLQWDRGGRAVRRWQWTIVLAVHLKPPTLGISALVKLAHHLVSRQDAILTDGCGSKQPGGYTWASNAFVEGRIPSQKCLSGFQPRTAESIFMRMSLMLQLRAGWTGKGKAGIPRSQTPRSWEVLD